MGSHDGNIYALLPDGTVDWQYPAGGDINSSPAIGSDGTLYIGSYGGQLISLTLGGSPNWTYTTGGEINCSPAVGPDGTLYAGSRDGYLYAINPDGTLKWRYQTGGAIHSSPAFGSDSTIYFGSNDNCLYALNADGSLKWRYETEGMVQSSPAIGPDRVIYVGSSDKYVYAVNPDGTLKWRYQTGHDVISSPAVSRDGIIYVGSSDGYLYALNPTGVLRWRYQTNGSIYSSPTVGSDGTILVGSNDFCLYAVNPDGSLKWRYSTSGPVASSPSIGDDGTVYVGSWDNYLYALNVPAGKGVIYGVVTDISTGAPLASATITTIAGTTQTGTRGEFVLSLDPGVYTLTISKTGYQTITTSYFYSGSDSPVNIDVNMTTPGSLNIVSPALPSAEVDIPYNERVRISGGTWPYDYAMVSGSLPPGMSLDSEYGNVSGIPTTSGSYTFTISVIDYPGAYADHEYTIEVTEVLEFVTDMILPRATQNVSYFENIEAVGGTQPYKFDNVEGIFPAGVGMSLAGQAGGSDFVERFGPGAMSDDWVLGGNTFPFVSWDDRLQFGNIGGNQRSYAQITLETNNQSSLRFDWAVASCGADYLRFFVDNVEIVKWNGIQGGTYTHGNIFAGIHTFRWEYNKDEFISCSDDTGWIDNVYIDDAPGVPSVTGDFYFRLKVTDDHDRTAEKTFLLSIDPALEITTSRLNSGVMGSVYNQTLSAAGGIGGYTWALFAGVLPPGLSLHAPSGTLTGTPTRAFYGTVVIAAHDESGRSVYKDYIIEVSEPLQVLTTALPDAKLDESYSDAIRIAGGVPPYTFSPGDILPDGLSLDESTGIISGTPTAGQTTNFSVTVTDSTYPDSQSYTRTLSLRVSADLTIMTTTVLPNARLDSPISPIVLIASGGPSPHTWQLLEGYLPDGITLDPGTGTLSGTPADYGDFVFKIQVTDGNANTVEKEFFWHVSDVLAIVTPAVSEGAIDDSYGCLLKARGGIKPYTWRITDGTLPSGLSLNPVTGVISGVPTALQTYSFTVRVSDNDNPAQLSEKEIVMTISGDLMIFTDTLPIMRSGEAFTANITAKLGVAPYSWSIDSGMIPPGLALIDSPNMAALEGMLTTAGEYTFAVKVTDTGSPAGSVVKTFTVPVYEDVQIDTWSFPSAVRGGGYSQYIDASGGKPTYTYQIVDGKLPFGLKLNSFTGLISGTVELVGSSSSTFTVKAIDSGVPYDCDEKEFTIYVLDAPPLDSDGDGLPDDLEKVGCTEWDNPDTDGDGILDGIEDANHNGIVDAGETDPCNPDSDGDGMPDGWEIDNNLNPLVDDANDDKDLDGFSNIREYVAGTNPDDINDKPYYEPEIEDFETGNMKRFPWITTGDGSWSVTTTNAKGVYSAQAALISDLQVTSLEINRYTEAGDMSFWVAVDSENKYDFFIYILTAY